MNLYLLWGEKPFTDDQEKRVYSREEKLKAIHLVLDKKKSARQVGLEMCIPNSHIVQDWVKKYKLHGEDILRASGLFIFYADSNLLVK